MTCTQAKERGLKLYWPMQWCKYAHQNRWYSSIGNCVECQKLAAKRWRIGNPLKKAEVQRKAARVWRKRNPAKVTAMTVKRNAVVLLRTPSWSDIDAVLATYERAARVTKCTGTEWHVDHIAPLQGKNVSGLHVPLNLRVIPAQQNLRKFNHFSVGA